MNSNYNGMIVVEERINDSFINELKKNCYGI